MKMAYVFMERGARGAIQSVSWIVLRFSLRAFALHLDQKGCGFSMKRYFAQAAFFSIMAASFTPALAAVTGPKDLPDGVQFTVDGGTLRVQLFADDIVRVTYNNTPEFAGD